MLFRSVTGFSAIKPADTGYVIGDYQGNTNGDNVGVGGEIPAVGDNWSNYFAIELGPHISATGTVATDFDGYLTVVGTYSDVAVGTGSTVEGFLVTGGEFEVWYSSVKPDRTIAPFFDDYGDTGAGTATLVMEGDITGGQVTFAEVELEAFVTGVNGAIYSPYITYGAASLSFDIFGNDDALKYTTILDTGLYGDIVGDVTGTGTLADPYKPLKYVYGGMGAPIVGGDTFADITGGTIAFYTPIPAAVWLFGTALMGLLGYTRRNTLFGSTSQPHNA